AAGETDLQHAQRGGFTYHAFPFVGGQLMIVSGARRIGTVRAMQRAPIREFGEQCVWTPCSYVRCCSRHRSCRFFGSIVLTVSTIAAKCRTIMCIQSACLAEDT